MALKTRNDLIVEAFRELAANRLNLPVPEFHSRWLMGQLVALGRSRAYQSVESLIDALSIASVDSELWAEVIHSITVHETYWLRNGAPLKQAVQSFGSDTRQLRILSLGCAYGQEAYTAFLLARHFHPRAEISVFGIDLSKVCIDRARAGRFNVTPDFSHIEGYLERDDGVSEGDVFQFSSSVRNHLNFSVGNILDPCISGSGKYDLILCQNCLTYYDATIREMVAGNLLKSLDAGGLILFAGAELMGFRPKGAVSLSDEWAQIFVKEF